MVLVLVGYNIQRTIQNVVTNFGVGAVSFGFIFGAITGKLFVYLVAVAFEVYIAYWKVRPEKVSANFGGWYECLIIWLHIFDNPLGF